MPQQNFHTLIDVAQLARLRTEYPQAVAIFDVRFDLAAPQRGREDYLAGHLPGAHYLHLDEHLAGTKTGKNGRHPLPDRAELAATLGVQGVSTASQPQVVAYDAHGGMFAARLWWLLRWLGYERVAVLDGGLPAWLAAGHELETVHPAVIARTFVAAEPLTKTVDAEEVLRNVRTGERVVIDARSPDRFRGENETLDPVGGHIPGARNRFFKDNLSPDGSFKDARQLRIEFERLLRGAPASKAIVQCGSGVTACHHVLAMEIAGLPGAALYPGSWSEWVADPLRPIATGAEEGAS